MKEKKIYSHNVRELCVDALNNLEKDVKYSNLQLNASLTESALSEQDRALFTALFYGVIEKRLTLDYLIDRFVKRPDKLSPYTRNILRTAIFQLLFLEKIPDHAAVFEACETAKKHEGPGCTSLVNGVLRNIIREKSTLFDFKDADPIKALSIKHSVPEELIALWIHSYGQRATEIVCALSLTRYPSLYVNTLKISRQAYCAMLTDKGIEYSISGKTDVLLKAPFPAVKLPGFNEGLIFIQDLSCQAAISDLLPGKNEIVVDVCACPGGKSFSAGIAMENTGAIYSFDIHSSKLPLITKSAERLGITNITARENDARFPAAELVGKADTVICDVPCSGFGVIAKKPEIRYKPLSDLASLPDLQFEILAKSSMYCAPGGKIMYSTCTLNPNENERVSERFLSSAPQFARISGNAGTTVFPDAFHDGFYYDIFIRKD